MKLSELKSHLWEAANTLRGSAVDRTDWKGYILPLLFFKRISDCWDEETAEAAELVSHTLGGSSGRRNRSTLRPRHFVRQRVESSQVLHQRLQRSIMEFSGDVLLLFLAGDQCLSGDALKALLPLVPVGHVAQEQLHSNSATRLPGRHRHELEPARRPP